MKNRSVIVLCVINAILLVIIVAEVLYLYSGSGKAPKQPKAEVSVAEEEELVPEEAETAAREQVQAEKPEVKTEQPGLSFTVTNCQTQKKNTLRQNADNSVELIDHNGSSLWKVEVASPIVGSPVEVDFYGNSKIQFLFVAGAQVHLLDRLGREVESYPRTLPAEAITGPEALRHESVKYYKVNLKQESKRKDPGEAYFTLEAPKIMTSLPK